MMASVPASMLPRSVEQAMQRPEASSAGLFAMIEGLIRGSAHNANRVEDMAKALSGQLHAGQRPFNGPA